jgi:hypothetical protein
MFVFLAHAERVVRCSTALFHSGGRERWEPHDVAHRIDRRYAGLEVLVDRDPPFWIEGNPGFLQLVAFQTDSQNIIWVERGWLPTGNLQDAPDYVPEINDTHRQLTLRLRPTEPKLDRGAPLGQLPSIDLITANSTITTLPKYSQAYGRLEAAGWTPTDAELGRDVRRLMGGSFNEFLQGAQPVPHDVQAGHDS